MLGDLAVAWERGYRAADNPLAKETAAGSRLRSHGNWRQSVVVPAVSEISSSSSTESSSSSYSSEAADIISSYTINDIRSHLAIQDVN
ncbi:hypothetical protein K443DRAFT_2226 [Laccaria amethystina LaAM-08-1]|uniref:Uncharacterized protein n=1 Tax=Laccaria amethystina LaAM-08-1 TaxID=1095629 RepID=A0A0C9YBM8_9AGAR|nr:hypothetical protein K443DRAFT_2226 [Laccaria amethystina LaAM-08-1]